MKKEIKLSAESRDVKNEKANQLRTLGFIPAVIYGPGVENHSVKVKESEFLKIFTKAGENHLIELSLDGEKSFKVLTYGLEKDPIKNMIKHVDFLQVNMKEKVTVEIPLHYSGESKAVKELGGVLVKTADAVEVECLPDELVDHILIHLSDIKTMDDTIKMSDLKLPKGMVLTSATDETLVSVVEPVAEEEPVPTEEAPSAVPAEEEKVPEEEGK